MTRIITTHYRYRRPPRRKPKGPVIEGPRIVHAKTPKPGSVPPRINTPDQRSDDATSDRKSAIVTIRRRKPATMAHLLEDMTPEEHKQRGDAADALWREMKRRIAEKVWL